MSDTMVYRFWCTNPVEGGDTVSRQLGLSRRYKNRLIELERDRRERVEASLRSRFDGELAALADVEKKIERLTKSLAELRAEASSANAAARSGRISPEDKAKITAVRHDLAAAFADRKKLRAAAFAMPAVKAELSLIDADDLAARKDARKHSGLYSGTYQAVEESMRDCRKGAPPQFRRWDGSGKVSVQIPYGITIAEAESGTNRFLRLGAPVGTGRRRQLRIRVAPMSAGGSPWATVLLFHNDRPIPSDGRIMWAHLQRRRIGTQFEWSVLFTVRGGTRTGPDKAGGGAVGIDVGWRLVEGGLRVCRWKGTDGESGGIVLPRELLRRWSKSESLRSIRDAACPEKGIPGFDVMRAELADWVDALAEKPAWLIEMTTELTDKGPRSTLRSWKSAERLGKLWWTWRLNRIDGDEEIFERIRDWRQRDRHLWNWAASNVVKACRIRKDLYRKFALDMCRKYQTAYIENTNWAKMAQSGPVENPDDPILANARYYSRIAAVGELMECVRQRLARVVKVAPEQTTHECHACGQVDEFDAASELRHVCSACGSEWDQDDNAAAVLLARGLASAKAMKGDTGDARGSAGERSYEAIDVKSAERKTGGRWHARKRERKMRETAAL